MEITKKHIIQIVIVFVIIWVLIGLQLDNSQNNRVKTKEIFKNAKFTIGTIIEYKPFVYHYKGLNEAANVKVYFWTKDSLVTGKQSNDDFFTPRKSLDMNKKYLVIYDSVNSTRFRILFDSPISDSSDFRKYLLDSKRLLKDFEHDNIGKNINK